MQVVALIVLVVGFFLQWIVVAAAVETETLQKARRLAFSCNVLGNWTLDLNLLEAK